MTPAKRRNPRGRFAPPSAPARSIRLKVLPESEEVGGVDGGGPGTVTLVGGEGITDPVDYTCGACGDIVAQGVERGQVQEVAIRCNGCGALNRTPS